MIFKKIRDCKFNFAKLSSITWENVGTFMTEYSVEEYAAAIDKRNFNITELTCSCCGEKGCMTRHGYYERYCIMAVGAKFTKIRVLRVKCKECGHTHAILPEEIIPYSQYSIYFIVMLLQLYILRTAGITVEAICEYAHIAVKQLYRWIRVFNKHKEVFLTAVVAHGVDLDRALKGIISYTSYVKDLADPLLSQIQRIPMQHHRNPTNTNLYAFQ